MLTRRIHGGAAGPAAAALPAVHILFAHAAGFCKEVWAPVIEDLGVQLGAAGYQRPVDATTFDVAGHGDAAPAPNPRDWPSFLPRGIDRALAAVQAQAGAGASPGTGASPGHSHLIGVGHSMGGAGMLMSELADPGRFQHLVLMEPIVFRMGWLFRLLYKTQLNPMYAASRTRRNSWPDWAAVEAHFRSGKITRGWDSRAIDAYIAGGFKACDDGTVTLKCAREYECELYRSVHDLWPRLPDIHAPVHLVYGEDTPDNRTHPPFRSMSAKLPNCTELEAKGGGHLYPMTHPTEFAREILSVLPRSGSHL